MGIKNFYKFLLKYAPKSITKKRITDYENKIIGFDANLLLYKIIYALRIRGVEIKNGEHIVTHIHTLLLKLIIFKKYNIQAVFVFDGIPPKIKQEEIKKRDIQAKINEKRYKMKTVSEQEISECVELIKLFNYPIIFSKCEADSQLAELSQNGIIEYIASDDADILLFGGKVILKNFTVDKKKEILEINLKKILKYSDLNQNQLIQTGILFGCDYSGTTMSIDKAYKLVKSDVDFKENKIIFDYYKKPPNLNIKHLDFHDKIAKKKYFIEFLKKFNYKDDYINNLFDKLF